LAPAGTWCSTPSTLMVTKEGLLSVTMGLES